MTFRNAPASSASSRNPSPTKEADKLMFTSPVLRWLRQIRKANAARFFEQTAKHSPLEFGIGLDRPKNSAPSHFRRECVCFSEPTRLVELLERRAHYVSFRRKEESRRSAHFGEESQTPSMHFHRGEGRNSQRFGLDGVVLPGPWPACPDEVVLLADHIGARGADGSACFIGACPNPAPVAMGRKVVGSLPAMVRRRDGQSSRVVLLPRVSGRACGGAWRGGRRCRARSAFGHSDLVERDGACC